MIRLVRSGWLGNCRNTVHRAAGACGRGLGGFVLGVPALPLADRVQDHLDVGVVVGSHVGPHEPGDPSGTVTEAAIRSRSTSSMPADSRVFVRDSSPRPRWRHLPLPRCERSRPPLDLVARQRTGPPRSSALHRAFWVPVPGAVGLVCVAAHSRVTVPAHDLDHHSEDDGGDRPRRPGGGHLHHRVRPRAPKRLPSV